MFNTNTVWFEIAIVTFFFLTGNVFLGHFEERSPKWKRLFKYFVALVIIVLISTFAGRTYAFLALGLSLLPVFYVHGILLPRKGINGWTGEPKSRYYEFRGWSTNNFEDKNKTGAPIDVDK